MAKERKKTPVAKAQEPLVYLGPSLRGIVGRGQVYLNGYPPIPEDLAEVAAPLVVPLSELAAAKQVLADPGSLLSKDYAKVQKALRGGK